MKGVFIRGMWKKAKNDIMGATEAGRKGCVGKGASKGLIHNCIRYGVNIIDIVNHLNLDVLRILETTFHFIEWLKFFKHSGNFVEFGIL